MSTVWQFDEAKHEYPAQRRSLDVSALQGGEGQETVVGGGFLIGAAPLSLHGSVAESAKQSC
jgi:hypothetical protein